MRILGGIISEEGIDIGDNCTCSTCHALSPIISQEHNYAANHRDNFEMPECNKYSCTIIAALTEGCVLHHVETIVPHK